MEVISANYPSAEASLATTLTGLSWHCGLSRPMTMRRAQIKVESITYFDSNPFALKFHIFNPINLTVDYIDSLSFAFDIFKKFRACDEICILLLSAPM